MEYSYLSLLERPLDSAQEAICCRAENTIAAAGAGSGKTQTLATRFAWLVMSKEIPASKILTLTFTKKAAGEMYERIHGTLAFFAEKLSGRSEYAEEQARAQRALADFSNVHIQTLDSYCAGIVRQAANRYGIRPDFSSGTGDAEQEIRTAALPFIIANKERPSVQAFANAGMLQDFAEEVLAASINKYTSLADKEQFFSSYIPIQCGIAAQMFSYFLFGSNPEQAPAGCEPLGSIKQTIDSNASDAREALLEKKSVKGNFDKEKQVKDFCNTLETISDLIGRETKAVKLTAEDIIGQSAEINEIMERCDAIKDCLDAISSLKYKDENLAALKEAVTALSTDFEYINSLCAYIKNFPAIKDLFALLDEFTEEAKQIRLRSGSLSFRDIQKMALKILREQDDIRSQEQHAYHKIMIDEFQDNNSENRDLLFMLAGKQGTPYEKEEDIGNTANIVADKLFFVGDEKQSIYKFRDADVAVFNKLQEDFASRFADSVLQMTNNYRSSKELLASFNKLFGGDKGIFDNTLSMKDYPYEAQYKADASKPDGVPSLPKDAKDIAMQFRFLRKDVLDENENYLPQKEQIAYDMAQKIQEILAHAKKAGERPSVAILDRSRTDRGIITKWLNRFGISYSTDQQSNLFDAGPVYDIYNFLRSCVYPSDSAAFAAYLASPFAGLSETSVETILAVLSSPADEEQDDVPFSPECGEKQGLAIKVQLAESEWKKYRLAQALYESERQKVLSRPLTDTLSFLWEETGYHYETLMNTTTQLYAEQYDMLFELARSCDAEDKTAAWFVDQLALIKDTEGSSFGTSADELGVKDIYYPIEKDSDVQIMSIHKSKGLQFGYVFVYGCTEVKTKADSNRIFFEQDTGASIKPENGAENFFAMRGKELAKKKELAEFRRLLYVAITRAEKKVFIMGCISISKNKSDTKADAIDFKLLEGQLESYYHISAMNANDRLGEESYEAGAPFTFYSISPIERSMVGKLLKKQKSQGREELMSRYGRLYEAEPSVSSVPEDLWKVTPSLMETPAAFGERPPSPRAESYAAQITPILEHYKTKAQAQGASDPDSGESALQDGTELSDSTFSAKDFGTLAHAYLEAFAKGLSMENYEAPLKLFKDINKGHAVILANCCKQMVREFSESPLGKAFLQAKKAGRFYRAEYGFKTCIHGYLFTGSIDLIFQNENGTYTLVDYKTDDKICEERYILQQTCYRIAAARLLGITTDEITCFLYFLRFGTSSELHLEKDVSTVQIEQGLKREKEAWLVQDIADREHISPAEAQERLSSMPVGRDLQSDRLFRKSHEYLRSLYELGNLKE